MSALPAEITQLSPGPRPVRPSVVGAQLRADRRAAQVEERRARRHWSILSVAVLGCSFGITAGVLGVLR
jgi:hypothetical protein